MNWNLLIDNYPPPGRVVIVKRVTGYRSIKIEILTACYEPAYTKAPWRDPANTALITHGEEPFAWTECSELEQKE